MPSFLRAMNVWNSIMHAFALNIKTNIETIPTSVLVRNELSVHSSKGKLRKYTRVYIVFTFHTFTNHYAGIDCTEFHWNIKMLVQIEKKHSFHFSHLLPCWAGNFSSSPECRFDWLRYGLNLMMAMVAVASAIRSALCAAPFDIWNSETFALNSSLSFRSLFVNYCFLFHACAFPLFDSFKANVWFQLNRSMLSVLLEMFNIRVINSRRQNHFNLFLSKISINFAQNVGFLLKWNHKTIERKQ